MRPKKGKVLPKKGKELHGADLYSIAELGARSPNAQSPSVAVILAYVAAILAEQRTAELLTERESKHRGFACWWRPGGMYLNLYL